ncbi:MAG: helix-turn-helix domain-containing protein, partial [Burkholderiales bacterium]|nr:helix-turn-helix domain-containing protein [Burkholderiales bacterium]
QRELRRANIKVKAVARHVGFASAEAFSRAYQREFGRPPVDDMRG